MLCRDVLNNIINDITFHSQNSSEIARDYQLVSRADWDAVFIYDCHYASFALADLHDRHGSNYLIRMKAGGGSILVKDRVQNADQERIVDTRLRTGRRGNKLK